MKKDFRFGFPRNNMVSIYSQTAPTSEGLILEFTTIMGNQPKTFDNHIYVWQTTSHEVPWGKKPDGNTPVDTDASMGEQIVRFDFEDKGYIIGYAVAPTPQAVCAAIFIPPDKQNDLSAWECTDLGLTMTNFSPSYVLLRYRGLSGYQPAVNKNWIGIWRGENVSYLAPPLTKIDVAENMADGFAAINDIALLIGNIYTIGYFMTSPGRTSLAATSTFTVE